MDNIITTERIDAYCLSLLADERAAGTVAKYRRDVTAFARWLGGRPVSQLTVQSLQLDSLNRQIAATRRARSTPCWPPSTAFSALRVGTSK